MGIMAFLGMGAQAGKAIAAPVDAIGNVLDKLFTSEDEKLAAAAVMEKIRQHPSELQAEINKLEAQHRSTFVAGWRPYIGWVLGTSLAVYYIPQFAIASYLWAHACLSTGKLTAFPVQDIAGMIELVLAMLGMAGLRTVEKLKNKTK